MRSVNSGCHPLFVSVLYLRHFQILHADFTVVGYSAALLEPPPARGGGRIPPLALFHETGRAVLPGLIENPRVGFGNTGSSSRWL